MNDLSEMLNQEDPVPLPIYISDKWNFPLQRYEASSTREEVLYSVQDWVRGLTNTKEVRRLINELFDSTEQSKQKITVTELPYYASNNRFYTMDFTDEKGLFQIAQELRVTKTRPLLNEIKSFLAKAGVLVDTVRRDPDAAADLIADLERRHKEVREKGKRKRINFTKTAAETHITHRPDYAALTNNEYDVLFGAAKDELVKTLELTVSQAKRFRDHISTLALQAIDAAETAAAIKMKQLGRRLTTPEQIGIVRQTSRIVAPAFWELADYLNIDLLSGNPRLPDGKAGLLE